MRVRLFRKAIPLLGVAIDVWPWPVFADSGQQLNMSMLIIKSVAALAFVLALFALVVWLMRRIQGGRMMSGKLPVQLEYRMNLDNRNALAIVRCDGQRWLVGISPNGVTRIDRLSCDGDENRPAQAIGEE